jgi:hypothetical protein
MLGALTVLIAKSLKAALDVEKWGDRTESNLEHFVYHFENEGYKRRLVQSVQ